MKTIIRRLDKLEGRFGLAPETEFDRQLRARIEAGRQRVAAARERGEWSGPIDDDQGEDLAGLSVIDILNRGRERVARAKAQKNEADGARGLASRDEATTVSGSPTKLADHDHEEDSAFIPSANPKNPPIINTIAQRHRLAKPKELGLNVHGNSRPNTPMARLRRTVNRVPANRGSRTYR